MKELNKTNLNKIRTSTNKIIRYNKEFLLKFNTSPLITNHIVFTPCAFIKFSDDIISEIPLNITKALSSIPCKEEYLTKVANNIYTRFEEESFCTKELSVKDFFSSIDKDNSCILINMGSDNGEAFVTADKNKDNNFCFKAKLLIPILTIFKALGDEKIFITRLATNKNVLKFFTDNVEIYATTTRRQED